MRRKKNLKESGREQDSCRTRNQDFVAPAPYHMPIEVVSVRVREHPHEERTHSGVVSGTEQREMQKGEKADFWTSEVRKYKEVPRSTKKYREVPRSTKKYREVRRGPKKSRKVQRSPKKYREVQRIR